NKVAPTDALIAAVRERVAAGVERFHVLVPNPHNLGFDHGDPVPTDGEELLAGALPPLREAAGAEVSGRVATSPNAYDDIVEELDGGGVYTEILLETPPSHLSHWLHVDLSQRVAGLGLPTEAVPAT
ncbi:MAG: hypothetical protein QOH18_242, partial [Solirubrobacterales bacterium]|nr:hypothetical protein [Solirubrobacterales bacterium]